MEPGSKSSSSSQSTPRWLWGALIVVSVAALLLNAWQWTHDTSRWSGFLLPTGMLLFGIVSFFDPRRGLLYKVGSILAIVLMLSSIVVSLLGWVMN